MSTLQGIRMKSPAHPGGFVTTEIIDIAQARKREGEIKVAPFVGLPLGPSSARA